MITVLRRAAALATVLTLALTATAPAAHGQALAAQTPVATPLAQAHAHNDYEHDRPLLDALDHGFTSVEADVWLVDGDLLIGHDRPEPGRTLRNTYLAPMAQRIAEQGGAMYPGWDGTFQLLIDVKTSAAAWPVIEAQLAEFPQVFTSYQGEDVRRRPAQAVISGNRDLFAMIRADRDNTVRRWSGFDGRWIHIGLVRPRRVMPLVSNNYKLMFSWRGEGAMPAYQRRRLRDHVRRAHDTGAAVRFWATPDAPGPAREAVWTELLAAGVDHINTDDLAGLETFLRRRAPHAAGSPRD